ncbi:DUF563 domain-containing protein [Labrys sp. KNU-23]|uniref:glycosyltransferase family 61 protein n=1 Tax=Labrys sp. KNU-23 TaxID=2789216 RepID=UPI00165AC8B2|nr:glycosyltransferase 61 family protein [Labrys sp. KNU-23]
MQEAICTEFRLASKWGFFNPEGTLVPEATDRCGLNNTFMFQVPEMPCEISEVKDEGLSDFIYGGRVVLHYGHFLIESLPRLWLIARTGLNGRKVLFQSGHALSLWYNMPFVAPCMHALGIKLSDIVQPSSPQIVRDILIPRPCMQQDAWVYPQVAKELYGIVSKGIIKGTEIIPNEKPVYLSKSRYKRRGTGITNEHEIEDALARLGVDILYPEELSLKDQIVLFMSRRVILGALGSAFHTAVFAQPSGRQIILAHNHSVNPNYLLFDLAGGNKPEYYYSDDIVILGQTADIGYAMECRNPQRVAEGMMSLAMENS